jgi:hypothetical protein
MIYVLEVQRNTNMLNVTGLHSDISRWHCQMSKTKNVQRSKRRVTYPIKTYFLPLALQGISYWELCRPRENWMLYSKWSSFDDAVHHWTYSTKITKGKSLSWN